MAGVTIKKYQARLTGGGYTHSVSLCVSAEIADAAAELNYTAIKAINIGGSILPTLGTGWTGLVAGETLDDPNPASVCNSIEIGDLQRVRGIDDDTGYEKEFCVRYVDLEWAPEPSQGGAGGAGGRPQTTGKESNDPDEWLVDFEETGGEIPFYNLPVPFLGGLDQAYTFDISDPPLDPADLKNTAVANKGAQILPVNSAGERLKIPYNVPIATHVISKYMTVFSDVAFPLWLFHGAVNDADAILTFVGRGLSQKYIRETARIARISKKLGRFYYDAGGAWTAKDYLQLTYAIEINPRGWNQVELNEGTMKIAAIGEDNGRGGVYTADDVNTPHVPRAAILGVEGKIEKPVTLDLNGKPLATPNERTYMVYGPDTFSFTDPNLKLVDTAPPFTITIV